MYTFDYEFINQYNGSRSPTGKVTFDPTSAYYARCLYQRLSSVFNFNLPPDWNLNYFTNVLFKCGFVGVIDSPKYGVIPQICTLKGLGIYNNPTEMLVAQPLVKFDGVIGENCELIRLTPDYVGVGDIVNHYADLLSGLFTSLNVAIENSRLSAVLMAKNKETAETLKVIAEKISKGESTLVVDKALKTELKDGEPLFTFAYNVKENYIVDQLLEDIQTVLYSFDREIGIPIVDNKKERMITDEVSALTSDSSARIKTWKHCLDESMEKVNGLFGLDLSYSAIDERGVDYETDTNRNV